MAGSHTDITGRKLVEEALREANLVVENSPVVLFRWKAAEGWPVETCFRECDPVWLYPGRNPLRRGPLTLRVVHPDDLDRVADEVRRYSEAGVDHFSQEYRLIAKSGEVRWVEDHTVIERDTDGRITPLPGHCH